MLLPINFEGEWKKTAESNWVFGASKMKFLKVSPDITYSPLVEKICVLIDISKDDFDIELTAWNEFPKKQQMAPFYISSDVDVSNYIELYTSRIGEMIPLCVTTREKVILPLKSHSINQQCNVIEDIPLADEFGESRPELAFPLQCVKVNLDAGLDGSGSDEELPSFSGCNDPYCNLFRDGICEHYAGVKPVSSQEPPEASSCSIGSSRRRSTTCQQPHLLNSSTSLATASPNLSTTEFSNVHVETNFMTDFYDRFSNVHVMKDFRDGELVPTKEELTLRLRILCMKANRKFKISHSDHNRIIVKCVDKNCKWHLRGSFSRILDSWIIRNYVREHTCSIDSGLQDRRGVATTRAIAYILMQTFNGEDKSLDPKHIMANLNNVYGVSISYWKAWQAKELALKLIQEVFDDSFKGLASYLWLLRDANPGTYTSYELESNNCFKNCFVSMGACISGFKDCIRPVLAVDATFLKGRYKGKLFIATSQDANNRIFPLAFGIAVTECDTTWEWFLRQLQIIVGKREDLVIISEPDASIEKNVNLVFPDALYGINFHHLGMNMDLRFREDFLYTAAKTYTVERFNEIMDQVLNNNAAMYDYLLASDPTKWARCHFSAMRYNIMTADIMKSMNNLMSTAIHLPIIGMIDAIRTKLQLWWYQQRTEAASVTTTLAKEVEELLSKRDEESRNFRVEPVGEFRFQVYDGCRDNLVDIQAKTCSCNVFQVDQLPCNHAIQALRLRNVSIYSVCSRYYTNATTSLAYKLLIAPVPHRSTWYLDVPEDVRNIIINPPFVINDQGQPKTKRIRSQGEDVDRSPPSGVQGKRKCSKCQGFGHNKKTCTGIEYIPPE